MRKLPCTLAAFALVGLFAGSAGAAPADKVAVGTSTVEFFQCTDVAEALGGTILCVLAGAGTEVIGSVTGTVLSSFAYKSSTSGDLIFSLHLECSLFTNTKATRGGPTKSSAEGKLEVWIEIDADGDFATDALVVDIDDTFGTIADGSVTFCNRFQELEVDPDATGEDGAEFVRLLLETKQSHGFTWVAKNPAIALGTNDFFIRVQALITTDKDADGVAGAGFHKRVLIVEPVHLAVGETF